MNRERKARVPEWKSCYRKTKREIAMSKCVLRKKAHHARVLVMPLLAGIVSAGVVLAQDVKPGSAIPDFYENGVGWITRSNDFLPPKSGLGPVTDDPAHPYVMESRPGTPQTFRVADSNHPALMPWVKEVLKKQNERCWPGCRSTRSPIHAGRLVSPICSSYG